MEREKKMDSLPRYKLIACEVLFREVCHCAAQSHSLIDITFMPKGLHDQGEAKMSARLQEELDRVDVSRYDAILLGYGLCNNGVRGLHSSLPIVLPRAHDCITLLLGSRARYAAYAEQNPGAFYHSTGWMERGMNSGGEESITAQLGMNQSYQEYVAKYGEENARYLVEALGNWVKNYKRLAYIDTQVGDFQRYKEESQAKAREHGWEYDELQGDVNLLMRLLNGEWDEQDFLVIPPQRTLEPTFDDRVVGLK
jgi:hypothetical protein